MNTVKMEIYINDHDDKQDTSQELASFNKEVEEIKYALDESSIIAITDQKGVIKAVNRKFCEISKYSEEELIGHDHRMINSGYHSKDFFRDMWSTIGSGKVWRGEVRNRASDGSLYWVHTTIVPILDKKGKPLRYISIRVDITTQKKMEAHLQQSLKDDFKQTVKNLEIGILTELKSTQKQLKENQFLYQSLFNHGQDAVIIFDINGKIININPATEKLLGYTLETIQNPLASQLFLNEYQSIHHQCFERALQGEPQNSEIALTHQNGQEIFLNLTYVPIIVDKQITGIYSIGKDITEQKRIQELNSYLAKHDELTKLLNRRGFEEKLGKAISNAEKNQQKLAILYIDLDRFKNVNDTLGHYIGDRLLEQFSLRLKNHLGSNNCIARMGGDEFMVLCSMVDHHDDSVSCAQELIDCINKPYFIDDYELFVTASIGICFYPTNGDNVVDLMKHADIALYKAKEQGRNTFQIYSTSMDQMSSQSFFLERDLRKALVNNEFIIHLQPRVDVNSRKMLGAEALIRWNHPKYGLIQPSDFTPLAEETGLIIPIGIWVKRKVCEILGKWKKEGIPLIPISINISAQRFLQKDFANSVQQILQEFDIDGSLLEVEITENSLMKNEQVVIQTINELKQLGIKIYIDDFGTGYSSFSYLKSFQLDGIKIDRSFIHNLSCQSENAGITSAMIHLASLLKMDVVAEGVETVAELQFLRKLHCNHVQGYLFAKPAPIEEFETLLINGV